MRVVQHRFAAKRVATPVSRVHGDHAPASEAIVVGTHVVLAAARYKAALLGIDEGERALGGPEATGNRDD